MLGTSRLVGSWKRPLSAPMWTIALACWAASASQACNVPVFRYALERWPPDPYHLAVFCSAEQVKEIQPALDALKHLPVRLYAETVDLDAVDADDWRLEGISVDRKKLPWAVLRFPPRPGVAMQAVWSGAWTPESPEKLLDSPVRKELVRRILLGQSAVWVLVESGDAEKDQAAKDCLERELVAVKEKLHIPGTDQLDYLPTDSDIPDPNMPMHVDPSEAIPLQIEFSLLSLSRNNPDEQTLLAILLNLEPDLHEYAEQPIAFPIFGQARALWALVGAGINAENILDSCAFLTGACSCQVKSMNPGTDILMAFDWPGALEGRVPPPPEITPDMLTAVAPRLDEETPAHSAPPATKASTASASSDTTPADPNGAPASPEDKRETTKPPDTEPVNAPAVRMSVVVIAGAVLAGLLLLVAAATVVLLLGKGR